MIQYNRPYLFIDHISYDTHCVLQKKLGCIPVIYNPCFGFIIFYTLCDYRAVGWEPGVPGATQLLLLLLFLALFQSSHLLRVPDGVSEELVLLGPLRLVGGSLGQLRLVLPDPALLLRGGRSARPTTRRARPLRKDVASIAMYSTGMVTNAILRTVCVYFWDFLSILSLFLRFFL